MRPRTYFAAAAIAMAALATARGQEKPPAQEQRPPTFRVEANFVRVDAFPTKDGKPVQNLTADDFELFEDGAPQKIASFEHVVIATNTPGERVEPNSVREAEKMAANPRNRVFVIYLDVGHVQVSSSHAIKEPLIDLMRRLMGADDLVAVMTPGMAATDMTFMRRTETIEQQLRDNWPWGKREIIMPMDERERQYDDCYPPKVGEGIRSGLAQEMIDRRRERMVLESLNDMVGYLGGVREERKAIVLVSEGWRLYGPNDRLMAPRDQFDKPGTDPVGVGPDGRLRREPNTTRSEERGGSKYECDTERMALSAMDNPRYFRDLLDNANRMNATFYPVDPRGLPVFDDSIGPKPPLPPAVSVRQLQNKLSTLREMAEYTDGIAIQNSNDLKSNMRRISDDLSSYYLLGYYATNTKLDGTFRNLKVRVKVPGVSVRARRGYRAATAAEMSSARTGTAAPASEAAGSVAEAVSELARIRPDLPFVIRAVPVATAGATTMPAIWIAGELQAPKDVAAAGGSATIEVTAGGVTTNATADLKPGERAFLVRVPLPKPLPQADVRARFVAAESPGTPAMTYTARVNAPTGLADPVVFRRGPTTGNRLVPVAGFVFSRSERARFETALGADDKPGAGRLLDRTGQPLQVPVAVTERTDASSGQRWLVGDVTLAALGAGDYAVELTATTPAGEKKVVTAIRVTR